MLLVMAINTVAFNIEGFIKLTDAEPSTQPSSQQTRPASWPGEVAEALNRSGIQPGDKMAIIGYGYDAFWARLARAKIVAQMLNWQADNFWSGDSALQSQVLHAFAGTGAKAIVAENVPGYAPWLAGIR